jgi:hypothetical protein
MSIPKDIDAIQVEVLIAESVQFFGQYDDLHGGVRLPGTLALVDEAPGRPFTVRVIALKDGRVRVLREIVTAAPDDGLRMLRAPIQWLCDGSGTEGLDGRAEFTKCPIGEACFAETCAPARVEAGALPLFAPAEVFGGGSGEGGDGACFDTVGCFDRIKGITPELKGSICSVPAEGATNVAIRTEGDGVCGETGCFIPLDEGDPAGFTVVGEGSSRRFQLPPVVCELGDKLLDVVVSPVCAPKKASLPMCGVWSKSGGGRAPDPTIPVALAAGQRHPASLALTGTHVFWTTAGSEGLANGVVKGSAKGGGTPVRIAEKQAYPGAIAVDGSIDGPARLFWINEGQSAVSTARADGKDLVALKSTVGATQGLALFQGELFWSTQSGQVRSAPAEGTGGASLIAQDQMDPVRIAVDATGIYWTDRGKGSVRKAVKGDDPGATSELAGDQARPIGLAVSPTHAYWVNQGKAESGFTDGAVMRVVKTGTNPSTGELPELIAASKGAPYAIAIDEQRVYWTQLLDGTITSAPLTGGGAATTLVVGQSNPFAIAVDDENIYWANAGTAAGGFKDGAIMKVKK